MKFSRPPGSVECGSREKYTSFARDPPICHCNQLTAPLFGAWDLAGQAYINSYMADHSRVVGQPDIPRIVRAPVRQCGQRIAPIRRRGFLVDDEGALHIDLHGPWVDDGAVDFGGVGTHARRGFRGARGDIRALIAGSQLGFSNCLRCVRRHGGRLLAIVPG